MSHVVGKQNHTTHSRARLADSKLLGSTLTGAQIVKAHTIVEKVFDLTESIALLVYDRDKNEGKVKVEVEQVVAQVKPKGPENSIEKYAEAIVRALFKLFPFKLVVTDKKGTKANDTGAGSIPDAFVAPRSADWEGNRLNWWMYASFLLEYKKRGGNLESNDHLGQCIQYGQLLLSACPSRQCAVVVLFNVDEVRLVVVSRASFELRVEVSPALTLLGNIAEPTGMALILHAAKMAHSSCMLPWPLASALGVGKEFMREDEKLLPLLNKPSVGRTNYCFAGDAALDYLGVGATSRTVFRGNFCVKIYRPEREAYSAEFHNELNTLRKVQDVRKELQEPGAKMALQELVFPLSDKDENDMVASVNTNAINMLAIVTKPVGVLFSKYNVSDVGFDRFVPIVQALKAMHGAGFVHCDLGPNNLVVLSTGQLVIIDWGMAIKEDGQCTRRQYSNSMWFTADSVLEAFEEEEWTPSSGYNPKTDLESVVKTIAYMSVPGVRTMIDEERERRAVEVVDAEEDAKKEAAKKEAASGKRGAKAKNEADEAANKTIAKLTPAHVAGMWKKVWKLGTTKIIKKLLAMARAGEHHEMVAELKRLQGRRNDHYESE